jgi:cell division initiation protein
MTSLEIQQQQFKTRFRGFDVREVDGFLEQAAAAFGALQSENEGLQEEIRRLKQQNERFQKREETFKQAMLNSQQVIEQMKENARKSADLIVAEAEVKAEKMLNRAHNRLAQLHEDITELRRQRVQIEVQIESILDAHAKLLEIGKEGRSAVDEQEAKVRFIAQAD